jgi:hypothetical protein
VPVAAENRLQGKRIEFAHRHLINSASGMEALGCGQNCIKNG